jgi:aromatic-L-amino-acid decarboxylase
VVICVGGTSVGAVDDVRAVAEVARAENLYTHVDAAWAGSAMICPELRTLWDGVELADSVVFNPHKWLGAPPECSAHFVRDPVALVRTLAIQPEYLTTYGRDGVVDFSEWSVQLGRRFRALKVWFLIRAYGLDGLRIRNHIAWAVRLAARLGDEPDFEIASPPVLSLFAFRYVPAGATDLDALNRELLGRLNDDGTIYVTQTVHQGRLVIRFVVGQFETTAEDVDVAFDVITRMARGR